MSGSCDTVFISEGGDVTTSTYTTEPTTGITALTALADVTDEVLCTVTPLVIEDTEAEEAGAVSLTRRGSRFILDCGNLVTATSLWSAISSAALEVRREEVADKVHGGQCVHDRPTPLMSYCRGQVALGPLSPVRQSG